jgi:hypothetical protein
VIDTTLIVDGIVIALLCATIFYAFRLERRLDAMRNAQASMAKVIVELNTAAARAEAGIQGLKSAAQSSGNVLDEKIKRARAMADELNFLIQAGDRLGHRIETSRHATAASRSQTQPRNSGEALRALGGLR